MSLSEDAKTIHVALAVGLLEIVRADEEDINEKSARSSALKNLIDNCWKCCDIYRVNAWSGAKLESAACVLDKVQVVIQDHFRPRKTVVRGPNGRFMAAEMPDHAVMAEGIE